MNNIFSNVCISCCYGDVWNRFLCFDNIRIGLLWFAPHIFGCCRFQSPRNLQNSPGLFLQFISLKYLWSKILSTALFVNPLHSPAIKFISKICDCRKIQIPNLPWKAISLIRIETGAFPNITFQLCEPRPQIIFVFPQIIGKKMFGARRAKLEIRSWGPIEFLGQTFAFFIQVFCK